MPGFELIGDEEKIAVSKIFDEGGVLFAHGFENLRKQFHVREFEKASSTYFDSKFALAVSSGTAAIKIALKALGVKHGDEVITQGFNFIATVEAILDCGAIPVIANVDKSLNMDPDELKQLINKNTSAIIPVHMLGFAAKMDKILNIAQLAGIPVIEDNCEAIGGKYNEKYLGNLADIGVLSFDQGKMIATGEGGMLLTNDPNLDLYARQYHDHGHENVPNLPRGKDSKKRPGFNYRMTEMQAAVGKIQLKKLNKMLIENKSRYLILNNFLYNKYDLREIPDNSLPNFDTFIFFEKNKSKREKIIKILQDEKFGTKNLPDAMEWHCTYFWDHALTKEQTSNSRKTLNILEHAIAIPIWLRKSIDEYKELAKQISLL